MSTSFRHQFAIDKLPSSRLLRSAVFIVMTSKTESFEVVEAIHQLGISEVVCREMDFVVDNPCGFVQSPLETSLTQVIDLDKICLLASLPLGRLIESSVD